MADESSLCERLDTMARRLPGEETVRALTDLVEQAAGRLAPTDVSPSPADLASDLVFALHHPVEAAGDVLDALRRRFGCARR